MKMFHVERGFSRANDGEANMSKVRSRLGRGLSSLISMPDEDESGPLASTATAGQGEPPASTGLTPSVAVASLPGELPVMRELPVQKNAIATEQSPSNPPILPADKAGQLPDTGRFMNVPVAAVVPNPHQPRKHFDEDRLRELSASLRESGVIQPIIVRPGGVGTGQYELIAGERRWRAAILAGLDTMPAIVRQVDPAAQARLALVENVQREDLNPIERAGAYATLLKSLGITQQELAQQLGEDRSSIANFLRLLELAEPVQRLVADGHLSAGHAKVLAGVPDIAEQCRLAELAVKRELSVRTLEEIIKKGAAPVPPAASTPGSAHLLDLEKSISRQVGMRVQIRAAGKNKAKGKLVIHYQSLDQFDQLLERMNVRLEES
jgi:ParB family transcriptional regulator, chromosome partitioning protein